MLNQSIVKSVKSKLFLFVTIVFGCYILGCVLLFSSLHLSVIPLGVFMFSCLNLSVMFWGVFFCLTICICLLCFWVHWAS